MFVDARTVPDGSVIETEVCIIGAGAAGITIARELEERPFRVVLLESGRLTADATTQSLYAGEVAERHYFPLDAVRTRTRHFGGTTNVWTGECLPLDAEDFAEREWLSESGWPFGLDHLRPFYERAQTICQLGPFDYTTDRWRALGRRPLAFESERVVSSAMHLSPPTRFGELYRSEIEKAATIVTYLGANVVDLETSETAQEVSAAKVACLSGNAFRVRARVFILATGGIENARLLLAANHVRKDGLGNTHDLVGRYFMEHLYLDAAATIRVRQGTITDLYTSGVSWEPHRIRAVMKLRADVRQRERLSNYLAILEEESLGSAGTFCRSFLETLRRGEIPAGVTNRVRSIGAAALSRLDVAGAGRPWRFLLVKNVSEQAPNPESRVVLSRDRDQLGVPRVVLRWRLSPIDRHTAHRSLGILAEELSRADVGTLRSALGRETDPWPSSLRGGRHHMGTTRMHADPRRGVVDANGRVHGIANLFVAGSSVFPTSGAANPTLTIVALAVRLAEHVKRRFEEAQI
jgi:choline dehydrogenase-like flavoprotein